MDDFWNKWGWKDIKFTEDYEENLCIGELYDEFRIKFLEELELMRNAGWFKDGCDD